jgi:peptidoglycan/xylan/chitin deacetylase (PgdA/CDA1 family)
MRFHVQNIKMVSDDGLFIANRYFISLLNNKYMLPNIRSFIRDLAGDLLYATGITQPSNRIKDHPFSIVTFHRVLPTELLKSYPINGIAVTPDEFAWFVKIFKKYFICGTLSENFARWQAGEITERPLLSITFDDGQLDNFLYAQPILKAAKIPATFFAVTNGVEYNETLWYDRLAYAAVKAGKSPTNIVEQAKTLSVGERLNLVQKFEQEVGGLARPDWDGMMNWQQLAELAENGHEIGCHSMTHPILPLCNDTSLQNEIVLSRKILQENLNTPITSFCYPNGDADQRIINLVEEAGYTKAVTTKWGQNKNSNSPFTLKRFDIQGKTSRSRNGDLSESRLAWRLSPYFPKRM